MKKTIADVKLQIRYENGVNSKGEPKFKNVNYAAIKNDAADEELMAAGNAIASLQTLAPECVRVVDTFELWPEE